MNFGLSRSLLPSFKACVLLAFKKRYVFFLAVDVTLVALTFVLGRNSNLSCRITISKSLLVPCFDLVFACMQEAWIMLADGCQMPCKSLGRKSEKVTSWLGFSPLMFYVWMFALSWVGNRILLSVGFFSTDKSPCRRQKHSLPSFLWSLDVDDSYLDLSDFSATHGQSKHYTTHVNGSLNQWKLNCL